MSPQKILSDICAFGEINYSERFKDFSSFLNVNGDVQLKGKSRGGRRNEIAVLPRKRIWPKKVDIINIYPYQSFGN